MGDEDVSVYGGHAIVFATPSIRGRRLLIDLFVRGGGRGRAADVFNQGILSDAIFPPLLLLVLSSLSLSLSL
jgi:hypothetical protein